ncbi:cytochrome c oxidase subunit 6A2, mitochondrial-like isoform X1 [Liolophura sinensis]|uniref:cytochrome c oxidase subunit 6A2, mitochondrial-like isoform X1 n=1 Tax=Liolophura sinensis TaxID=3198878 RepID=UPI0031586C26
MASRLGNLRLMRSFASAHGGHGGQHAGGSANLWKMLTFGVALPGVALCYYNAYYRLGHEHPPRDFVAYEHLRLRSKAFPWGDGNHTLFHNPHTNPLPDGFEDEH